MIFLQQYFNRISLFLTLSLSLSFSFPVYAEDTESPLVIALDQAWHPLSYLDEDNQPQGVLIDYWRSIMKKTGRPVKFMLVDWQKSLELVRNGKADIHGGLFQSAERDTYLEFSDELIPLSTRLFVSSKLNARNFSEIYCKAKSRKQYNMYYLKSFSWHIIQEYGKIKMEVKKRIILYAIYIYIYTHTLK